MEYLVGKSETHQTRPIPLSWLERRYVHKGYHSLPHQIFQYGAPGPHNFCLRLLDSLNGFHRPLGDNSPRTYIILYGQPYPVLEGEM